MRRMLSDLLPLLSALTVVLQLLAFNIILHSILCGILVLICVRMIVIDIRDGFPENIWYPSIIGVLWLANLILHLVMY